MGGPNNLTDPPTAVQLLAAKWTERDIHHVVYVFSKIHITVYIYTYIYIHIYIYIQTHHVDTGPFPRADPIRMIFNDSVSDPPLSKCGPWCRMAIPFKMAIRIGKV